ncbi:MAG: DUF2284 domain-containing protein [Oscillospiraceae bacterium]|nr:DUF2284 domain-containing protein [Oscillospiraceae bacterium]
MLLTLAKDIGFSRFAAVDVSALLAREDVRQLCAADRCGHYGKNWSCPPYAGELTAAQKQLARCTEGVLVQTTGNLADEFDIEGIGRLMQLHSRRFATLARQARLLYPKVLPLSAGPCTVCRRCTCPTRPCRFPQKRLSSMEAFGLMVGDVCRAAGLPYSDGSKTMTFTSCILIMQ